MEAQRDENEANQRRPEIKEFSELVDLANKGDEGALVEIRELLETSPAAAITVLGGDLAQAAETMLVNRITEGQAAFREALRAKLEALRAELGGSSPSPTERLLVDRVVTCWLQLAHADALAARVEKATAKHEDYLQRRQDRTHRRYLSAVKMLATVRKMALPLRVDVNVGRRIESEPLEQTGERILGRLPAPTGN
ncbi:MAG: hypothetical protein HQ581_17890 [Planctomycetes bacterium]|nr:hypothetical protein [Planctomycetota bacterium]